MKGFLSRSHHITLQGRVVAIRKCPLPNVLEHTLFCRFNLVRALRSGFREMFVTVRTFKISSSYKKLFRLS